MATKRHPVAHKKETPVAHKEEPPVVHKKDKPEKEKFDVEKLHDDATTRIQLKRNQNGPFGRYDIDIKKSYEVSLALIENSRLEDDEKKKQIHHLESVLSAGQVRYA